MPAVSRYDKAHVDRCRARVDAALTGHARMREAAGHVLSEPELRVLDQARLADLLVALDAAFADRPRRPEGKDGGPLTETRLICAALCGDGVLTAVRRARYDAAQAVLSLPLGEPIQLDATSVKKLARAFLDEIERRYG